MLVMPVTPTFPAQGIIEPPNAKLMPSHVSCLNKAIQIGGDKITTVFVIQIYLTFSEYC